MLVDYQAFIERMIARYEGGYGWNRNDPGGPTKYGITCFDLAAHRGETMDSMVHWAPLVRAMPMSEADDIYQTKYATATAFNALNAGKDTVVFDFGVNSGPSRAIHFAQAVVGVAEDGILGPVTLAAINSCNAQDFVNQLCGKRLRFLQGLGTWSVFGTGWTARVMDLRAYSMNLAYPPAQASYTGHSDKLELIPLAFAKGYCT